MLRGAYSRLFASPRWPGWRIAVFYGLMCLLFSRELVPFSVAWVISRQRRHDNDCARAHCRLERAQPLPVSLVSANDGGGDSPGDRLASTPFFYDIGRADDVAGAGQLSHAASPAISMHAYCVGRFAAWLIRRRKPGRNPQASNLEGPQ